ncbi:hypothetical protein GGI04_006070 [Coemansia thaxteri]|uniref:Uncharacterized protein n=1 Tax=Coemansia thaxteri TaxID=2663907 RepID=A0A9W8BEU9_9FUNG|nr:hypothetical protein GGI04_006070 [Coemansia thaxteri]KAJ2004535.1 hypothetical protein H4R26_002458 [Coemansia thaxteri]KAJ2471869.1 hypothetical protein GGI02_001982 [Coemansia sp. RSA 2322]KAJ2484894.1 hypothetical protein EV174_002088 [Coemansia sp. RSA 2320]
MPTPMPASIRKRSELHAKNIHKRGNVKSSLDPKTEQKHEAERLRKKGLGKGATSQVSSSRKLLLALLGIIFGSALYQICLPLFGGRSSSGGGSGATSAQTKSSTVLTREEQAKAAEAVLRALNQQAADRYMKSAKSYKPPAAKAVPPPPAVEVDSAVADDEDETPVIVPAGPLV